MARRLQRSAFGGISRAVGIVLAPALRHVNVTAVQLQIIHAPGGEESGVLDKVILAAAFRLTAACKPAAGGKARVFINAKLQTERMDSLSDGLDTLWESLRVGLEVASGIAIFLHPAVVDRHRVVAKGGETRADQCLGIVEDRLCRVAALVVAQSFQPIGGTAASGFELPAAAATPGIAAP
jgi:hypothetical protein